MKKINKLFLYVILCIGIITHSNVVIADNIAHIAHFGNFGIQLQQKDNDYQKYIGQTVEYIGNSKSVSGFSKAGGKYNTDYIITKIKVYNDHLKLTLTEKNTDNEVKIKVYTHKYSFSGDIEYYLEDGATIPLLLTEKFAAERINYIGKEINNRFVISDVRLGYSTDRYPVICYEITDKSNGSKTDFDAAYESDLDDIGTIYSNPKFTNTYTVVNVKYKSGKHYIVKNSIDGTTKDILSSKADSMAFAGDDDIDFYSVLSKVEKPANPDIRYGNTTSIVDSSITKYSYVDNFIDMLIFTSKSEFNFILKNISDNSLKIIWNEAVFVDVDGSTSKVMHSGTKYSQKDADQPPTVIIKGAKISDTVVPIDRVFYDYIFGVGFWNTKSLYINSSQTAKEQTIKLMIPIQIKDVVNEYIFEFAVNYGYLHPEYIAK